MSNTIEITNVGPIERLEVKVPEDGGVVVLRGRNGSGKSTALESAAALTGKGTKLSTRDGVRGTGRIDGLGATVILGNRITRAGELEVSSLEGRISIADLVQPPLKDPGAADRQRIKALLSLTGVEPSVEMFREVVGDAVDDIEVEWTGDIVEVAGRVKRALENKARAAEREASIREGQAKNAEDAVKDIDENEPHDEAALRAANIEAASVYRSLEDLDRQARAAVDKIAQAREKLEQARAGYTGPTVEDAKGSEASAEQVYRDSCAVVTRLEAELRDAKHNAEQAHMEWSHAVEATHRAEQHAQTVASYEEALEAALPEPLDPGELDAARRIADEAAVAVERGAVIRQALDQKAKAAEFREAAAALSRSAENLRTAAGQIDDTLSRQINSDHLFVVDGRLYAGGHARGDVPFAELSEGERWTLAFDAVAPVVGEGGIVVLPQTCWDGLDSVNRRHVAELARSRRIVVLTAEATEGDLVCGGYPE